MAALDLSGFVTPANEFEGLDRLSSTLYNQRQQKAHIQQQRQAEESASTKFITNYLSDKDKFTGTKYDPNIHEYISNAQNQAMGLIRQGANINDVVMAIDPIVKKADTYSRNAQTYAANKKGFIDRLKGTKGIDIEKLNSEIDKQAFPEGVDLSQVDPNIDYGDMALKNGNIYNTEGIDESFLKAPKNTEVGTVKYTNKKGGMEKQRVKLTAPYYAISEKDADGNHIGFVPKYQTATDEGNELIHTFETEQGKVNAPVRLFDKDLFDAMPANEKAYFVQETRKYANAHNVDLSSKQAENFARALAYDEKKARINGTYEHIEETKENPIKIYNINKPTQGEVKAAITASDLHKGLDETEIGVDGKIPVDPFLGGITVLTNSRRKVINQPQVSYDPKQKTFTYKDPKTGEEETVSIEKFKSMAKSSNPQSDIDYLEGFKTYKRNSNLKVEPPPPPEKEKVNPKNLVGRFFDNLLNKTEEKPKATTTPPVMKNKPDYYNNGSNVSKSEGSTVTYKDGTIWEIRGNKMVQVK